MARAGIQTFTISLNVASGMTEWSSSWYEGTLCPAAHRFEMPRSGPLNDQTETVWTLFEGTPGGRRGGTERRRGLLRPGHCGNRWQRGSYRLSYRRALGILRSISKFIQIIFKCGEFKSSPLHSRVTLTLFPDFQHHRPFLHLSACMVSLATPTCRLLIPSSQPAALRSATRGT